MSIDSIAKGWNWLVKHLGPVIFGGLLLVAGIMFKRSYDKGLDNFELRCKTQYGQQEYWGNKCAGKVEPKTVLHDTIIVGPQLHPIINKTNQLPPINSNASKTNNNGPIKNQNNGINNGHIGDESTYTGIRQRHVNDVLIKEVLDKFPLSTYKDSIIA